MRTPPCRCVLPRSASRVFRGRQAGGAGREEHNDYQYEGVLRTRPCRCVRWRLASRVCTGRQAGGVNEGREEGVMQAGHWWLLMVLLLLPRRAADGRCCPCFAVRRTSWSTLRV